MSAQPVMVSMPPGFVGSARPMGSAAPGSAAPAAGGPIHPDFPQLGPPQPYPTTVTENDQALLERLAKLGYQPGQDGLPGFPYIGAPYIGVYDASLEGGEVQGNMMDDEEVRGTQV